MKLLLKGPLDTYSGYGNDVVGLVEAFASMGIDLHLKPVVVTPPIDPITAQHLMKAPERPIDIGICYMEPNNIECDDIRDACSKTIAWTMWEYESYIDTPAHRHHGVPSLAERLKRFDLLLVTDDTSMKAFTPHAAEAGVPIKKLAGGYRSKLWKPIARDWSSETFHYGMVGRLDRRKGPWIAIGAFLQLKHVLGDAFNAQLHLKTTLAGLEQVPHPDIKVYTAWWTYNRLLEFYGSLHCLLAPSTGEGKNVPCLEALSTGMPVIATDYGGHTEWLGDEWAYRLPYEMVEFEQGKAAKVAVADMAEQMLRVYQDRATARRKGEVGARVIPAMCDWEKVARRFLALEDLR